MAVILSGCGSNSFDFDDFNQSTTPDNGDMTDNGDMMMTPIVGVAASGERFNEGQIVEIVVSANQSAPAGGLAITISLGVAAATEFNSGDCTGLICTKMIPANAMVATATLTLGTSIAAAPGESWTAQIVDGDNYNPSETASERQTAFLVRDIGTLPAAADTVDSTALESYAFPASANIRAGGGNDGENSARQILDITGLQYDDASGNPQVFAQRLEFAALGIWINGDVAAANDFRYANLADNVVMQFPATSAGIGRAFYEIEGDAIYNGVRFYPDGALTVDFDAGNWSGGISATGADADDDFGVGAMLPDGVGGMRVPTSSDTMGFEISFPVGTCLNESGCENGFSGAGFTFLPVSGFFSEVGTVGASINNVGDQFEGRFHDDANTYDGTSPPAELSGVFDINPSSTDANRLRGGFLGKLRP